ncbi:MAG TPA: hypothetical protein V6C97_20865, partial [Oculatellaceae cyanobacterium]
QNVREKHGEMEETVNEGTLLFARSEEGKEEEAQPVENESVIGEVKLQGKMSHEKQQKKEKKKQGEI